jgi:hypothetical protein
MKILRVLFSAAAIVALVGCGAPTASTARANAPAPASVPAVASDPTPTPATPSPKAALKPTPSPKAAPKPTPKATPVVLSAAERAALRMFVANGPQQGAAYQGYWWTPCWDTNVGVAACPFFATVKARLTYLGKYYFTSAPSGPNRCAGDYITGTQNGLFIAPKVLSAVAHANGSVTVVIRRAPVRANLTAVMTKQNGTWLASDLDYGTGPSASIFSAQPNC